MDSYLVCYDISDPKRLRRVASACEDFGYRRQYSVFLCRLSATDVVRLRNRLHGLIDLREDQVLFIPVCGSCVNKIEALGRPTEAADARDVRGPLSRSMLSPDCPYRPGRTLLVDGGSYLRA